MIILDGKATSLKIKEEIKQQVDILISENQTPPHLVAVLVGDDGASKTYVANKIKSCEQVGFKSSLIRKEASITQEELLEQIKSLNEDNTVDGYIVQLPLPQHIDEQEVLLAIDPTKDVDGFHPMNIGKLVTELPTFIPATPFGIMELLERYKIDTNGKKCVVIGRSTIVGRPMSILMSQKREAGNATVTLVHSRSKNIEEYTKKADIVIVALGIPNFLKADMVKENVVVIDVGITRVDDSTRKSGYKLVGDVDFEKVSQKASYITPVPGGVGPMTIAMLLKNTLKAKEFKTAE